MKKYLPALLAVIPALFALHAEVIRSGHLALSIECENSRVRLSLAPPRIVHKTGCISRNAAFCRLVFLQLPSNQIDTAEACGSRTQTLDSQRRIGNERPGTPLQSK
jgi:hypothetical protein